jgi:antitoxin PrlF
MDALPPIAAFSWFCRQTPPAGFDVALAVGKAQSANALPGLSMEEATLTSKSQITVPKAVRDALGLAPGDKIQFVPAWSGYRLVVLKGDIRSMSGVLKGRRKKPVSIAEMNRSISLMGSIGEEGAAAKARRRTGRG